MNELEQLIAAIGQPEPTAKLDERVYALFVQTRACAKNPRWMNTFVACGAAACIALLGFYAGRQSVGAATDPFPAMASPVEPSSRHEGQPVAMNVTKVPLGNDQIAGLFVRPNHGEGLLGNGPVTILTSTSP
jgi:hypothetical protein